MGKGICAPRAQHGRVPSFFKDSLVLHLLQFLLQNSFFSSFVWFKGPLKQSSKKLDYEYEKNRSSGMCVFMEGFQFV